MKAPWLTAAQFPSKLDILCFLGGEGECELRNAQTKRFNILSIALGCIAIWYQGKGISSQPQ